MSFDWQTEDAAEWQPQLAAEEHESSWSRRWLWILAILLLVGAVAAWRQIDEKAKAGIEQRRNEVLASHSVVQGAGGSGDRELLVPFLSGKDSRWASAWEKLAGDDVFFDRAGLGLIRAVPANSDSSVDVVLSNDLTAAEVTAPISYLISVGNGLTGTVHFEQTVVYRKGPDRWLLSPPEETFWGTEKQHSGRYLILRYPERDEELARTLAMDIDLKLGEMCTVLRELVCPPRLRVDVVFSRDPQTLLAVTSQAPPTATSANSLELPAPSLVGVPLDDQAYQALFRGYAGLVVSAVVGELVEWRCCHGTAVYQALLGTQLENLSLVPSQKVKPASFQSIIEQRRSLDELHADLWTEEWPVANTIREEANMLAAFINEGLAVPPAAVQRTLARSSDSSFWPWMRSLDRTRIASIGELERQWDQFAYERSVYGTEEPPLELPNQKLQLVCQPDWGDSVLLYEFDPAEDLWRARYDTKHAAATIMGLPGDEGVVVAPVAVRPFEQNELMFFRGEQVTEIAWPASAAVPAALPRNVDPSGSWLLLGNVTRFGQSNGLLPLNSCLSAEQGCALETIDGMPTWSPDGANSMLFNPFGFGPEVSPLPTTLVLADGYGTPIGPYGFGDLPFWRDQETFGFVQWTDPFRGQVLMMSEVGGEPVPLLDQTDLAEVGGIADPARLEIVYVAVSPQLPDQLLVAAVIPSGIERQAMLFAYDLRDDSLEVYIDLASTDRSVPEGFWLSPDGLWLEYARIEPGELSWNLYLVNLASRSSDHLAVRSDYDYETMVTGDWDATRSWKAVVEPSVVRLVAPGHSYEKWIFTDGMDCSGAAWTNSVPEGENEPNT